MFKDPMSPVPPIANGIILLPPKNLVPGPEEKRLREMNAHQYSPPGGVGLPQLTPCAKPEHP